MPSKIPQRPTIDEQRQNPTAGPQGRSDSQAASGASTDSPIDAYFRDMGRPGAIELGASLWRRIGALLIDFSLLALPMFMVTYATFGIYIDARSGEQRLPDLEEWLLHVPLLFIPCIALVCLYEGAATGSRLGTTLGKRALGLRVVSANGYRLSFARAAWRCLAKCLIVGFVPMGAAILLVTAICSSRRRSLHDMFTATVVVMRR